MYASKMPVNGKMPPAKGPKNTPPMPPTKKGSPKPPVKAPSKTMKGG